MFETALFLCVLVDRPEFIVGGGYFPAAFFASR